MGSLQLCFMLMALQVGSLHGQQPNQSPAELASRLLEDSCKADNFSAFYLHIREKQGMARKFPVWPAADHHLPAWEIFWSNDRDNNADSDSGNDLSNSLSYAPYTGIIPFYEDFWLDLFSVPTVEPNEYTWCVYLFSEDVDAHGCIGNGTSWATPEFERLGLLEKLSTRDVGPEFGLPVALMALTIDVINANEAFPFGNLMWHNALVTLNIHWRDPTGSISTVGEYKIVNVHKNTLQYITDISSQADSFLVEGQQREFYCEVHGAYLVRQSGWRSANKSLQFLLSPCDYSRRVDPCGDIFFFNINLDSGNCNDYSSHFAVGTSHMILRFRNPTINDTGEYVCYIGRRLFNQLFQTRSFYIYVVFVEVFGTTLQLNQEGELRCTVKAPSNSNITVRHNRNAITEPFNAGEFSRNCDHLPRISASAQPLEDGFALFSVTIHICSAVGENIGTYQCVVEYLTPADSQLQSAIITADVTIKSNDTSKLDAGLSLEEGAGIGVSTFLVSLLLIATVTLALCLLVIKISQQRARKRNAKRHLNVPLKFSPVNPLFNKETPVSPPQATLDIMEFSRRNLELHDQIGKGRFGKVMVASAYNIIPHFPTLNRVAVKMALTDTTQSNELMLAEVEVMKQVDSHKNICNLLAYCTAGNPVYIIMEYACHGNLKEYLDACRQTILQPGQSLFISSTYRNPVGIDSSSNSEELLPGYLSESNVQKFAFQIACGLEHLEAMEIVHCDLAARNILISEGFVLKIGDFGMSKRTSDEDNYQHVIDMDGIVAVKWAALEALENKGYFFKSDVWSFAVIVWEIASYGSRPFTDHKIGVSLDRFVQFLRAGNRLPQPNKLSDSIYQTLLTCWSEEPSARPSSTTLKQFFQEQSC